MKAYYLVFFIMFIVSLFYNAKTDKQWRWKLFWTFLPLFIYAAIRVDYGNDYMTYSDYFYTFHNSSWAFDTDSHAEIGYQLLNKIMPSFRSILVLGALLLCLSLGVFCYHIIPRNYLWLAVILIFLNPEKNIFGTLVGIRNGFVVSSFLLCFLLIQKRTWMPYFVITALLSFIHTSALFFMPVAYILGYSTPFKKREIWIWVGMAFVLLFFSMTQLAQYFTFFINNEIFNRYEAIIEMELQRGVLITLVSIVNIFFFIRYFMERGSSLDMKENSLLRIGILYSVMFFFGSLSARSSYYLDMFYIGSVIMIFNDKKMDSIFRYAVLALAIITSYYSMFHVWMGAPSWNHEIYHSLLGSW